MRISELIKRRGLAAFLRYGAAVVSISCALGLALSLRHFNLPHPFTSFSFTAIAITFWYAGLGPGIFALLLASLAMNYFFVPIPVRVNHPNSESYLVIYAIFGVLVGWFSASRRRAERWLRDARDNLELRVEARTRELRFANVSLQSTQGELRSEKDRLKLLLDLTNNIVSNLELHDVLKAVIASVREVIQSDVAAVGVPDMGREQMRVSVLDSVDDTDVKEYELALADETLPVHVFRTAQSWSGKVQDLQEVQSGKELSLAAGLKIACVMPLVSRGRALGVLILGRRADVPYTQEDINFLEQIAKQMAIAVEKAIAMRQISELTERLSQEKLYLEDEIRTDANFKEIIGTSAELQRVLRLVETVAPTDSTVLIYGGTGTGKELIARAIHDLSGRRGKTFVRLNCAAIPTGLLESELFGHEKGAFTGAIAQHVGRLELAHQGTLFLDEIGEIPLEVQPKLLRVLQEREFERLGSTRTLRTDVRLIAATNRDLAAMVQEQKFRSDLFFRLNVFPVQVPSLRERAEDIPLLVRHFAKEFSRRMNKKIETIPSGTMKALCEYSWPGNIRELQNVIERAVILSTGTTLRIPVAELRARTTLPNEIEKSDSPSERRMPVRSILAEVDRDQIIKALAESGGRIGGGNGAAARLGLKRTTFITRMKKLGIDGNHMSMSTGRQLTHPTPPTPRPGPHSKVNNSPKGLSTKLFPHNCVPPRFWQLPCLYQR